jgi:L-ribulokinase
MGTSTCDMLVAPIDQMEGKLVKGICGQVNGSVIPGMVGLEAGQSAFGDTYAWWKNIMMWPVSRLLESTRQVSPEVAAALKKELSDSIIRTLSEEAEQLPLDSGELALDWLNGRRTPDADQKLKAAMSGLQLGTTAPHVFKALVEATCFGAKAIVDRFVSEGVPVKGLIGLGGVAKKSPYVMRVMASVMNMPLQIHKSEQTCAVGAAMFAATAAGIYPRVEEAMEAMGQGFERTYEPDAAMVNVYAKRYERFKSLGEAIERQILTNS